MTKRLRWLLDSMFGRKTRPEFEVLLREALDEPLLLLSPRALERSLEATNQPFHPNPQ